MSKFLMRLACVAVAATLSACAPKGSEFVGKWQSVKYENRTAEIERNGDNFLIKHTTPSLFGKGGETKVRTATYKDGVLQFSTGMGTADIGYHKDSDTLLMPTVSGSLEYRRVK